MKTTKIKVIVAEDEDLIAKNIAKNIERANPAFVVVDTASDGEHALALIEEHLPDVVFTDVIMPVMDGLELLKNIAQKHPSIQTVVVSGHSNFEYARTAMKYKTSDYLLKPINFDDLARTLANLQRKFLLEQESLEDLNGLESVSAQDIARYVKEYISANFHQAVSLSDLATKFGFSLPYLTKIFTEEYHVTPSRYLIAQRMSAAKRLLRTTDHPVNQISTMVGYTDPFHFSKSFKKNIGLSPAKYRKKMYT